MFIVIAVLAVVIGAVASIVILSYAIAWYEAVNDDPVLMEGRFSLKNLWLAFRLILMETFAILTTSLLLPFGLSRPKEAPPRQPDETPVILLHGLFENRACWLWVKFRLRRRGFRSLHTINLPPWKDIESLTERVAKRVDELRHAAGIEKVHLVGHSMGGIIARNYLQIRGGGQKVDRCVLLAAPNCGSKLAPFSIAPLGKVLLTGSEFLKRLAQAPLPATQRIVAIYTRHDNMVLPVRYARLDGAINIELAGMGHSTLLYHPRAFRVLAQALSGDLT
jgi:pimeloyl-ACP methyl ester carboxylesterase